MEGEEVGDAEDGVDALRVLDAELAEPLRRDERVVRDRTHAEPDCAARDLLADAPEAEHAERLSGELHTAPARSLPATRLQRRVRLRNVASERHEEPDRVLGGRDHRRLRCVRDDDAVPCRSLHVDVVDAHPGAADHLQLRGLLDEGRGELRRAADDDRVVVADHRSEIRLAVDVDVVALPQKLDAGLGDLLPDEDSHVTRARLIRTRRAPPARPRRARRRRPSRW